MKSVKLIITILPLLISVVFFSVGFSSWFIATTPTEFTSSGLQAENVYLSDDYVTAENITISSYTSLNFIGENSSPSDTGSIVVSCKVNIDNVKKRMQEKGMAWNGTLNFTLAFSYTNLTDNTHKLFSNINNDGYYRKLTGINTVVGQTKTALTNIKNSGEVITVSGQISNLSNSGDFSFGVELVFNIPMNNSNDGNPSNFRYCFGKYIKNFANDKTRFVASVRISETE